MPWTRPIKRPSAGGLAEGDTLRVCQRPHVRLGHVAALRRPRTTPGGELTAFFIDRGQSTRLRCPSPTGGPPEPEPSAARAEATRMKAQGLEQEPARRCWLCPHAAQQERKAALDPRRVDTVFQVSDQVMRQITGINSARPPQTDPLRVRRPRGRPW